MGQTETLRGHHSCCGVLSAPVWPEVELLPQSWVFFFVPSAAVWLKVELHRRLFCCTERPRVATPPRVGNCTYGVIGHSGALWGHCGDHLWGHRHLLQGTERPDVALWGYGAFMGLENH